MQVIKPSNMGSFGELTTNCLEISIFSLCLKHLAEFCHKWYQDDCVVLTLRGIASKNRGFKAANSIPQTPPFCYRKWALFFVGFYEQAQYTIPIIFTALYPSYLIQLSYVDWSKITLLYTWDMTHVGYKIKIQYSICKDTKSLEWILEPWW